MGSGCIDPCFLDLGSIWSCKWLVSLPGRFTPGTHWIGGWVGPRAGMHAVEKILDPTVTQTSSLAKRWFLSRPW
jgi:hypothetical protein